MTDLERVRDALSGTFGEAFSVPFLVDIIDTHLKEDAERERVLEGYVASGPTDGEAQAMFVEEHNKAVALEAELTRLCEERDDARTQRNTALAVVELAEAQRDALLAALKVVIEDSLALAKAYAAVTGATSMDEGENIRRARTAIAGVEGPTEEQRIGAAIEGIIQHAEGDLVDRMSTDKGPVFYDADQERWVEGKP